MHRALVALLLVSAVGCQKADPPVAVPPRPEPAPTTRQAVPTAEAPKLEDPGIPPWPDPDAPAPAPIDAARAIKIAEQFVRLNGYTDYEPPDAHGLVGESFESLDREDWIALAPEYATPRALGYFRGARNDPNGWTVGFELVKHSDGKLGKAVTMNASGNSLRMQHQSLILKYLQPRPE